MRTVRVVVTVMTIGVLCGLVVEALYRYKYPLVVKEPRPPLVDLRDKITSVQLDGRDVRYLALPIVSLSGDPTGDFQIIVIRDADMCPTQHLQMAPDDIREIGRELQRTIDRNETRDVPVFDHH